ncbi:MAG: hypothetical protein KAS18_06975 [Calditrichia bacterium]|nr:hypothetical protein [Calditrichia bacterium]
MVKKNNNFFSDKPTSFKISVINLFKIIESDKFLILIPLLTVLIRLLVFFISSNTYEDAFITFRYAENLANGFGLVYNIGEKVYGTTTPLFAIVLASFKLIGISCITSSLAINLIAEGITSLIVYKFLKDYSNSLIAVFISLLIVFSPSNISWSIQGMETAFFSSVIALSFFCFYKKKYLLALLFGFLCAIIRIDGLSVIFVIFIFSLIKLRLSALKLIVLPLLLYIAWEISLFLYYGTFLPNSMMAKLILYSGHQTSIMPNISLMFSKFFITGNYSSSIISVLFFLGVLLVFIKRIEYYPMVGWFFIYYLALIFSKTHIHGWYFIPPLFVFITISGIAIIFLFNTIVKYFSLNRKLLLIILTAGILSFSFFTLYLKIIQLKTEYHYEQNVRIKVGKFLSENTPRNSTVFLEPIGIIGYFADRYIYDDAALISPIFLDLNRLPNTAQTRFQKIEFVKPDYLVLRNKYLDEFYTTTRLLNDYKAIQTFDYHLDPEYPSLTIFQKK